MSFQQQPGDISISQHIQNILNSDSQCLEQWNEPDSNQYNKIKNIFIRTIHNNNQSLIQERFPYCSIIPSKSIDDIEEKDRITFEFSFKIIIQHKNELYCSDFIASYHQIKSIYDKAYNSNLFPKRKYPTGHHHSLCNKYY